MSYLMNTTTTAIYTLSLHDALPISQLNVREHRSNIPNNACHDGQRKLVELHPLAEDAVVREAAPHHAEELWRVQRDRKSTRLNSSHSSISYAVFCLKKKIK